MSTKRGTSVINSFIFGEDMIGQTLKFGDTHLSTCACECLSRTYLIRCPVSRNDTTIRGDICS